MARCARVGRRSRARREGRRDGAFSLAARPSFVHETPQARIVALRISRSPGLAL